MNFRRVDGGKNEAALKASVQVAQVMMRLGVACAGS